MEVGGCLQNGTMFHPKYGCNMMHGLEGEIGYQSGSKVRILTTCHQIMYLLRRLISSVGGSCRHRPGTVFFKANGRLSYSKAIGAAN